MQSYVPEPPSLDNNKENPSRPRYKQLASKSATSSIHEHTNQPRFALGNLENIDNKIHQQVKVGL